MRFLFALCCLFSLLTTISATISGRIYQGPGCTGMLISTRSNITSGECLLNDDRTTYSSVTCNAQGIATFAWFTGSDCQTGQYASGGGQGDGVTCMNIQIQTATISGYVNCNEAGDATTTTPTTVMPTTAVPVTTTTPPTSDMPTTAVPTTSIPTTLAPTTTTPVTTQPPKILAIAFMLRVNQDYNTITIDAQTKTNWINNFIAALCRNMGILFRCSRLQVINLVPGSVVVTTVVTPPMENEPTQISTTTATSNLLAALNNSQSDLRQTLPMDPTLFNSTTIQSCDDGSFAIACVPVLSSTGSSGSISSTGSVSTYTGPRYNDTVTSSSSTVYSSSIIYVVIMMIALVTLFN